MRLRVATWNVHSCVGTDGRYDPLRTADALNALDADVIGLQEVDWRQRAGDAPQEDQLGVIADELGMYSIAGPNLADHRGDYGNALLTRLPIIHAERVDLAHTGREPRGAIDARLYHEGRTVHAFVTHLGLSRGERKAQADALRARVDASPPAEIRLLIGDVNEWFPFRTVSRTLHPGCFPAEFHARSFPGVLPVFSLDRIYASPAPDEASVRAVRTALTRRASDHLPVVADLAWADQSARPAPPAP